MSDDLFDHIHTHTSHTNLTAIINHARQLVEQLDTDLAKATPAQFTIPLMRGRMKALRTALEATPGEDNPA